MKKFLLMLLVFPSLLEAQNFSSVNESGQILYYNILSQEKATVELTRGAVKYKDANYTIPEKVVFEGKTFTVTAIGDKAFYERDNVKKIVVPNSVEVIGSYAFEDNDISEFTYPLALKSIGTHAFWNTHVSPASVPPTVFVAEEAFESSEPSYDDYKFDKLPETLNKLGVSYKPQGSGVSFSKVFKFYGKTREELYSRATAFFVYQYVSGKAVYQLKDDRAYTVYGKGFVKGMEAVAGIWDAHFFNVWHILKIECKDGAARVTVTVNDYEKYNNEYNDYSYPAITKNPPFAPGDKMYENLFEKVSAYVVGLIENAGQALEHGNTVFDEDEW